MIYGWHARSMLSDDVLSNYLQLLKVNIYRGSLKDVLSRYLSIAKKEKCRLCGKNNWRLSFDRSFSY